MAIPEKYSHIKFVPPSGVRREAEYGLKLRREHGRGGTAVGIARARDLSNGKEVSPSTVRRMKAFFDRHASDAKAEGFTPGDKGFPSNGKIANLLWGGPSGYSWAKKVVEQMNAADEKSRSYSPDTETRSLEVKETGMQNVERRYLAASGSENSTEGTLGVEHRADPQTGEKRTYLIGYAAKFNTDSLLLGDFVERIAPSAFEIVEKGEDLEGKPLETRGLFNHDPNHLIGRFPNTMKLTVDKIGLKYEIMLPESRKDLAESVARGDLKGSSFSFVVAEGGEKWTREGGKSRRLVTKIKSLLDCGPVTYPAYRDSSVAVAKRSYEQFAAVADVPKVDFKEEMRKLREFYAERRGFCPTGPGGGIDNSCGGKGGGGGEKPADDVGADVYPDTAPAIAGAAAGAALGAIAGVPGAVVGGLVGLAAGAVGANHFAVKVEKALKRVGSSIKRIDKFARTLGKAMEITATGTGGIQAEGGGVKMTIEKYAKDEVGKSLAGKVAFIENATNAIGGEGTESVGRLAGTLAKAGRDLGVDHVMVALDTMDRLHEEAFVDAGFTHSITGDDATRITMIKSYKRSSKRYDELMAFYSERRGFCPTGEGGGVDNSCGKGGDGKSGGGEGKKPGGDKKPPLPGGQLAGYKVPPKMGSDKPTGGKYKEWKKGDHLDKSKEKDAQDFLDKAREEQLSKGGKDKGKADEGGGVQTWSKGDHFPWTVKQVGDGDGYLQGVHPDGSKTEQYPFKGGDTSEAEKMLGEELKGRNKKSNRDRYSDLLAWCESRGYCPTGPGGGIDNSCGSKGGGQKPLDANDPVAVKSFLEKMAKETGMDLQGRPVPQAKDTATGGAKPSAPAGTPKTLEQIRLEAAGLWKGQVASKQASKLKASREKAKAYKDEIRPLKDALRKHGAGWVDFATKSNAAAKDGQLEDKTRRGSYRVALEELQKGPEAFKAHLDRLGVKRRSIDPRQVVAATLRFLKDRR